MWVQEVFDKKDSFILPMTHIEYIKIASIENIFYQCGSGMRSKTDTFVFIIAKRKNRSKYAMLAIHKKWTKTK